MPVLLAVLIKFTSSFGGFYDGLDQGYPEFPLFEFHDPVNRTTRWSGHRISSPNALIRCDPSTRGRWSSVQETTVPMDSTMGAT